jgi:hypothetical protein
MSNLGNVLQQLRVEHKQVEQQAERLSAAISAIEGIVEGNGSGATSNGSRPNTMSAAGRARIAAAQRARWAKVKSAAKQTAAATAAPVKRTMSASARRRIAAAQRARWAKVRKAA